MSNSAQGPKEAKTVGWSRSTTYYMQNIVIGVEECLYSVPSQALTSHSPVFEGMFDVGDQSRGEGGSDDKPIVLEGYKSEDFECLLKVLLPRAFELFPPTLTKQGWASVLKLATIWQMDKARNVAIEQLSALDLSPIESIQYAREYYVSAWLREGIIAIVSNVDDYKMEEIGNALGWQTTALILSLCHKAKPKAPQLGDWAQDWECACGLELAFGIQGSTNRRFFQCPNSCNRKFFLAKQPLDALSAAPPIVQKTGIDISEDAVAIAFAEEIKALDSAFVVS
ncbi:hypothetical protein BKA70DRAFT_1427131 [Coprinopsis sp. MPI-PUGE-AT-0042]|nr:hypothetical protein BKA70DRAFT_1427131 [Coprinopsis sp. MPI-PUGE-AT-0042]